MTDVDLDFLARQQDSILAEISGLRGDIRVLAASLLRAISGASVARTKISCMRNRFLYGSKRSSAWPGRFGPRPASWPSPFPMAGRKLRGAFPACAPRALSCAMLHAERRRLAPGLGPPFAPEGPGGWSDAPGPPYDAPILACLAPARFQHKFYLDRPAMETTNGPNIPLHLSRMCVCDRGGSTASQQSWSVARV
jgi:hypothetical protein